MVALLLLFGWLLFMYPGEKRRVSAVFDLPWDELTLLYRCPPGWTAERALVRKVAHLQARARILDSVYRARLATRATSHSNGHARGAKQAKLVITPSSKSRVVTSPLANAPNLPTLPHPHRLHQPAPARHEPSQLLHQHRPGGIWSRIRNLTQIFS